MEAFWKEQPVPLPAEEGPLLACTADGKGVPVRQASNEDELGPGQAQKEPSPGGKKMALIGPVYTVAPFPRTPQEVLEALFHEPGQKAEPLPTHPGPCFKRVRAALCRDAADTTEPQTRAIFSWIAREDEQRNWAGEKPVILLMDGQESLWKAGWEFLPDLEVISNSQFG